MTANQCLHLPVQGKDTSWDFPLSQICASTMLGVEDVFVKLIIQSSSLTTLKVENIPEV